MLKQEIIKLKEQLNTLSTTTTTTHPMHITVMKRVKTSAKIWTCFYKPFSCMYNDPNLFFGPKPSSEWLLSEKWFCTNDLMAQREGWLAELYEFLPVELHPLVCQSSEFDALRYILFLSSSLWLSKIPQFWLVSKSFQSTLIDRMWKAAPLIFKLSPDIFKPLFQCDTVPQLMMLLNFASNSKHSSSKHHNSKFPPLIYPPAVQ